MRLSVFKHARDNEPKPADLSWDEFVRDMVPHTFDRQAKLRVPMLSPAIYPPNTTRANANVIALSSWWGDFDHLSEPEALNVLARVADLGWQALAYTSWRHPEDPFRFRVVIPLSREVHPDQWEDLWNAINHALGNAADTSCTDTSRCYFAAYGKPGDEEHHWHNVFTGTPVDVDALLTSAPPPPSPPPDTLTPLARARVEAFSKALKRKTDDYKAELGRLLSKVCNGESFAEPGNIDNTIFKLTAVLADRFEDATPKSVGDLFAVSLQLMAQRDPAYAMSPDQVADKFRRAQEKRQAEQQAAAQAANQERAARIRDAFGTDRSHPYTDEEIKAFNSPRWIVQKASSFYTFVNGEYRGPYTKDEIFNAALRDLAPASTAGVEFFTISAQGNVLPKPIARLVTEYGFIAANTAASLSAQRSYFDEASRTLVEAPTPLRDIKPKYHAEIDQWLDHLAGPERVHLLKAWIAAVTLLDKPCTALFLTGVGNAGKSMIARGLARLWTVLGTPTPLEDVLGTNFNDALITCPLIFADERLPTDHRGQTLNAELRHFIQATRRKLRRKHISTADLIGATRLIIGANNEEILATTENLSNHDIGATIDRYLHIRARIDAVIYLQQIDHSRWVEDDLIAEHALWLRDNYEWTPNGRFLVQTKDTELHAKLATGSGIRSAVCQFLVGYLLDPGKVDNDARGRLLIRVKDGRLFVNTQALVRCWEHYVTNERCPTTGRLAGAIASLSKEGRHRLSLPNGKRPNYREIDIDQLYAWGERSLYATKDQIDDALSRDTEERATNTLN